MSRDSREPSALSVREAIERYLRRRRADSTESSVKAWKYRLKLFREWTEEVQIESVGELRGYDFDDYYEHRASQIAPVTLEGEMWTLRMFVEYLEQLDAVGNGLHESVRIPDLDPDERSSEVSLDRDPALALLRYYRNSDAERARRRHAFLELAWYTGARQGALRGLDVRDLYLRLDDDDEQSWVEFRHRPESGTPLKNKIRGERPVGIPDRVARVLSEYVGQYRYDSHDDSGRQPLLASSRGRAGEATIRAWSYRATIPCLHGTCPHGKDPDTCDWVDYHEAAKCPSSRSPHQIRTGSITWQLNIGIPPEVVAERVNASVKTIADHYDWASEKERWRRYRDRMENRTEYVERLDAA